MCVRACVCVCVRARVTVRVRDCTCSRLCVTVGLWMCAYACSHFHEFIFWRSQTSTTVGTCCGSPAIRPSAYVIAPLALALPFPELSMLTSYVGRYEFVRVGSWSYARCLMSTSIDVCASAHIHEGVRDRTDLPVARHHSSPALQCLYASQRDSRLPGPFARWIDPT